MTYIEILRDADDRSMSVNTFENNDPVQDVVRRLFQARGEQVPAAAELFDITVFGLDEEFVSVWFTEAYEFMRFSFTRKEIDALCTSPW